MRRGVTQPGSAEPDGRTGNPEPEGPDGGRDAQLDPGAGVPADEVVDGDPLDGLHRLIGNPVTTHLVRPELPGGQPVGVQAAGKHPVQPAGLDDVDAAGVALAEEALAVLSSGL